MTDDTGMLQHAIFTIPNRSEGYTTDDNARGPDIYGDCWSNVGAKLELARESGFASVGFLCLLFVLPRACI